MGITQCIQSLEKTERVIQTGQSGGTDDVQHWIQYTEPRHANTNVNMGITQVIHSIAGGRHYVRITD